MVNGIYSYSNDVDGGRGSTSTSDGAGDGEENVAGTVDIAAVVCYMIMMVV